MIVHVQNLKESIYHLYMLKLVRSTKSSFEEASLLVQWKKPTCQCRQPKFDPWVRKIPQRRKGQPTPVFLPEKSHGWRSLAGCSYGVAELDMMSAHAPTHIVN